MQASEEALNLGHPRLRETTFILWSTLAKVYMEEFDPFLEGVTKGLFESLQQEETDLEVELGEEAKDLLGTEIVIAGKKIKVSAAEGDNKATLSKVLKSADDADDDVIDLDDADSDDEAWDELTGITAVAMEKEIALEVIGDIVSHTKSKYFPYLEKTIELGLGLVDHSYEGVRKSAIGTLWRAYTTVWEQSQDSGRMKKWEPGLPLKVQPTPDLIKFGGMVMAPTISTWKDEPER